MFDMVDDQYYETMELPTAGHLQFARVLALGSYPILSDRQQNADSRTGRTVSVISGGQQANNRIWRITQQDNRYRPRQGNIIYVTGAQVAHNDEFQTTSF